MKQVLPRFCSPAPRPTVAEAEEPPPFACAWPLAACCLPLLWECVLCAHAGRGPVRRAAEATGRGEAPGRWKYELPIATMPRGAASARDSPKLALQSSFRRRFVRCVGHLQVSNFKYLLTWGWKAAIKLLWTLPLSLSLSLLVHPLNNRTRTPRQLPQTHD